MFYLLWAAEAPLNVVARDVQTVAQEQESWPSKVVKLDENHYIGKEDEGMFFVMERLKPENVDAWIKYGETSLSLDYNNGGLSAFIGSLKTMYKGTDEITKQNQDLYSEAENWICYATSLNPKEKLIDITTIFPEGQDIGLREKTDFIKMTMIVISTPEALLTGHMGISKNPHTFYEKKSSLGARKYLSLSLHSFGAKVMLLRNPNRFYMTSAPMSEMLKIIGNNMPPYSVFMGEKNRSFRFDSLIKRQSVYPFNSDDVQKKFPPRIQSVDDKAPEEALGLTFYDYEDKSVVVDIKDRAQSKEYPWFNSKWFVKYDPLLAINIHVLAETGKLVNFS